jgi:hypothetical protein
MEFLRLVGITEIIMKLTNKKQLTQITFIDKNKIIIYFFSGLAPGFVIGFSYHTSSGDS